jgi:hypothetical protein
LYVSMWILLLRFIGVYSWLWSLLICNGLYLWFPLVFPNLMLWLYILNMMIWVHRNDDSFKNELTVFKMMAFMELNWTVSCHQIMTRMNLIS